MVECFHGICKLLYSNLSTKQQIRKQTQPKENSISVIAWQLHFNSGMTDKSQLQELEKKTSSTCGKWMRTESLQLKEVQRFGKERCLASVLQQEIRN